MQGDLYMKKPGAGFQAQGTAGVKVLRWDKARVTKPKLIRGHGTGLGIFIKSGFIEQRCVPGAGGAFWVPWRGGCPITAVEGLKGEWGRLDDEIYICVWQGFLLKGNSVSLLPMSPGLIK